MREYREETNLKIFYGLKPEENWKSGKMRVFNTKLSSYLQQGNLIKAPAWEYFQIYAVNFDRYDSKLMGIITVLSPVCYQHKMLNIWCGQHQHPVRANQRLRNDKDLGQVWEQPLVIIFSLQLQLRETIWSWGLRQNPKYQRIDLN